MRASRTVLTLLIAFGALAQPVHAAEAPPDQLISQIEGVYKHRFSNGLVNSGGPDERYEAEDVVEIVRYDDSRIYFRARLIFYNGHQCGISGLAGYEKGAFLYHDPEPGFQGAPSCTLKIGVSGDQLTLTDRAAPDSEATCRDYCGVRGSLSDYSIDRSSKRKIRYLDRLKSSRQYVGAVDKLQKQQP